MATAQEGPTDFDGFVDFIDSFSVIEPDLEMFKIPTLIP